MVPRLARTVGTLAWCWLAVVSGAACREAYDRLSGVGGGAGDAGGGGGDAAGGGDAGGGGSDAGVLPALPCDKGPYTPTLAITSSRSAYRNLYPTLTPDVREVVWATDRTNSTLDLWTATRPDALSPWTVIGGINELNTTASDEDAPQLGGANGLVMVFSSGAQIYATTRSARGATWAPPTMLTLITTTNPLKAVGLWPTASGWTMHFVDAPSTNTGSRLFVTTATDPLGPWSTPVQITIASDPYAGAAHITYPGNCLYYIGASSGSVEVATRTDLAAGFPAGVLLSGLAARPTRNGWDDTPWVSDGAGMVYFSRFTTINGWPDIYEAIP